jgi:hypothetical protein
MANRNRGQRVKREVAGSGFLNHITTSAILPEKYQPAYYAILHDLDYANLECDRQIIAWQIAYHVCRLYQLEDRTTAFNDSDRFEFARGLEQIPKMTKTLIDLINAFHRAKRDEEPTSTEEEKMDFKTMIDQLLGSNDRHSEVCGNATDVSG